MKTKTLFTNYIPRLLGRFLLCVSLVISCFAISQMAQAVLPAPDGGYPGGNTAEGQSALLSLTSGGYNTAVGFLSLASDTVGAFNTAIGAGTLLANTANDNTAIGAGALFKQRYWRRQHGQRNVCSFQQHRRQLEHGHWFSCAF
ncbi:MAG TPA: hypothetical protein VJ420_12965 [Candidatus Udaeobacter sp.]|nr:hypothetical protein [Candidatus Udaeobacter sp.]